MPMMGRVGNLGTEKSAKTYWKKQTLVLVLHWGIRETCILFLNIESMTMTYLTLNVLELVEGHVKIRKCALFKKQEIFCVAII